MTTLALGLEQNSDVVRAIIWQIGSGEDEDGYAIVLDIYEVDNNESDWKQLRSIVTRYYSDCRHVKVEKATVGSVPVGNHHCLPSNTRNSMWKKAWANIVNMEPQNIPVVEQSPTNEQLLAQALFDVLDSLGALGNSSELCGHGFTEERAKEIVRLVHKE